MFFPIYTTITMTENLVPNSTEEENVTEHQRDAMFPSWLPSSAETSISNESTEEIALVEDCDESDDESDDGSSGSTPTSGWFVCPCFRPKPKKISLYDRLDHDQQQQSLVDPITTTSLYEAPLEKMTRRPSNESVTDSETEEESCSSYSYSDDENDVISDEYCTPRRVTFGSVEIREYAIVIGDHLSPKQYPISLDWAYAEPETISVDDHEYEANRRKHKRTYGSNLAFWLTPSAVCKNSTGKKGTESFRLSDPRLRFDRLCSIMALSKEDLCALEVARISKFIENRRRVTVGLPPI